MNIEIANKLLKLRKEKGYSQEQLAEKLGISRQAVSKWERAEASPDTDNLIELCKLYGVSLDELLLNAKPKEDKEKEETDGKDYAHVGWDGIHVKDKKGDEVHISTKGIHVESQEEEVSIDDDGVYVDGEKYTHKDFTKKRNKKSFPFEILVIMGYLIFALITGKWHPWWIVLFAVPIIESIGLAMRKKKISKFNYPELVTVIYMYLGFQLNLWHPGWAIFMTIPIFYGLANYIDD